MFVLIARLIYHVTLTARGSKQFKGNHFQMRQTRHFPCKIMKILLKYKMIQNDHDLFFSYIFKHRLPLYYTKSAIFFSCLAKRRHVIVSQNRI